MINGYYTNIDWCRKQMKKCKKIYNFYGKFFIFSNVIAILLDFILMLLHPASFWYFADFIIRAFVFYFGMSGSVRHDSRFCGISLGLCAFLESISLSYPEYFSIFYPIFNLLSMIGIAIIIFNNITYKKLENAEGFPYFNERLEKQKEDMQKFIDNDYQAYSVEDFCEKCSSNSKMDDI